MTTLETARQIASENSEILILMISTMVNFLIKPYVTNKKLIPVFVLVMSALFFVLVSDSTEPKVLILWSLYLFVIVTVDYVQNKISVEKSIANKEAVVLPTEWQV